MMLSSNKGQSMRKSLQLVVVLCSFFFRTDLIRPSWALADFHARSFKNRMSRSLCADDGPLTSFASNVTLNYSVVCEALPPSDIVLLQGGIMEAYNDLLQPLYCDPFSRRVSNVTYVSETRSIANGSQVAVRFLVGGTCQGCESMSPPSFFDAMFSDQISQQDKAWQEGDETMTTCTCPVDAIANRTATQDEFLTVYESVLARAAPELLCVTTDTRGLVPTGQPSAVPTVLGFDCPITLSTPLISQLVLTLNENATQSSYEGLSQDLINTYNALINKTYTTCQTSKYRQMTDISINLEATFVKRRTRRDRQLQSLVPSQDQLVFFQVEGGCAGCDTEELFFDPVVLSQDDFVTNYSTMVDTGLDFFREIVTVDCSSNISSFETAVIIEYLPQQDLDSDGLSSNNLLKQQLQDIYVKTYNDLRREYCDPYARQIFSANIVSVGENNTFGNIPVMMELSGNCSNCDGLGLRAYDVPSSIVISPTGNSTDALFFEDEVRKLFSPSDSALGRVFEAGDSSCYCPAHPAGARGMYETEFLDAYRKAINETLPITSGEMARQLQVEEVLNLGLGLEVAECQFGTEFRTGLSFGVETASLTEDEENLLVESLRQTIDNLYTPTDELCNPEFRVVQIAELGPTRSSRRRRARQVTRAPIQSRPSTSAPRPAPAPSKAPSFTGTTGNVVELSIYVAGVCNGCRNPITRGDQTIGRRLVQDTDEEWFRRLQPSEATSNCFCPIGSEISVSPTITELQARFQENLIAVGLPYPLVNFEEVPVVDCTTPSSQFSFAFTYAVLMETDATAPQVQAVGDVVRFTYNDIAQDFCDPYDQTVDTIELIQFSLSSTGTTDTAACQEYDVTFRLTGRCRGCSPATLLSPSNTRRLNSKRNARRYVNQYQLQYPLLTFENVTFRADKKPNPSIMSERRLQASIGDDCFCDGQILGTRPPTVDEYNNVLAAALNDFQLTNVCGLPNLVPTADPTTAPTSSPTEIPTVTPLTPAPALLPTLAPITPSPITSAPVTPAPATPAPMTPAPLALTPRSTPLPVTPAPVTLSPVTATPVTLSPATPVPITPPPVTPSPVTPAPITPSPVTPAPITPSPVTPAPITPSPVTPSPVTPAPITPAPVTPAPITPAPVAPAPITPAPVITPAPTPAPIPIYRETRPPGAIVAPTTIVRRRHRRRERKLRPLKAYAP